MAQLMKIHIIGAGFTGLAVALASLERGYNITLYDPKGIGKGASGTAAGIIHPFTGQRATYNWMGREGLTATKILIALAEQHLKISPIIHRGLIRLAITDEQKADFFKTASQHDDVQWLEAKQVQDKIEGVCPHPGIYIPSALAIDSKEYLNGLWKACQAMGGNFIQERVDNPHSLPSNDLKVVCAGFETPKIEGIEDITINPLKGQVLVLEWPKGLLPLKFALSSKAYIVMNSDNNSCTVGATFERNFKDEQTDIEAAKSSILHKAIALIPALKGAKVLACHAGIRGRTPGHLPIIKKVMPKTWVVAGMGSKGILYHALFAKQLIKQISEENYNVEC